MVVAAPAMGQGRNNDFFGNGFFDRFGQQTPSGDVNPSFRTSNADNNSNVCAPAARFANIGHRQNSQGFITRFDSGFDKGGFFDNGILGFDGHSFFNVGANDVQFEASSMRFEPSLDRACEQSVRRSSAAMSDRVERTRNPKERYPRLLQVKGTS